MRIQHNIMAMNTARMMNKKTRTTEHMTSGYKINCSADNAAGLAISEKMRGQIRGLNRASSNAEDGISMIQTAEGGTLEISAILHRVRELSVQAGNDTYTTDDRFVIQDEIDNMLKEIDRIAEQTEYNQKKVLSGKYATPVDPSMATAKYSANVDFGDIKKTNTITVDGYVFEFVRNNTPITLNAIPIELTGLNNANDIAAEFITSMQTTLGSDYIVKGDLSGLADIKNIIIEKVKPLEDDVINVAFGCAIPEVVPHDPAIITDLPPSGSLPPAREIMIGNIVTSKIVDGTTIEIGGKLFEYDEDGVLNNDGSAFAIDFSRGLGSKAYNDAFVQAGFSSDIEALSLSFGKDLYVTDWDTDTGDSINTIKFNPPGTLPKQPDASNITNRAGSEVAETDEIRLQVGANGGQEIFFYIESMKTRKLGLKSLSVMNHDLASDSITKVDKAINKVSANRGTLGSVQNRLEHIVEVANSSEENLQAAESSLRDADFADDAMMLAKENILMQSAQSILAGSMKNPESVLNLLNS